MVAAAGAPGLVTADMVKPGAAVVGAKLGDEVRYEAPNGREIMVVVTRIEVL